MRQSLGLSRGVDEREADECRLDPRARKESRCHRGSGRVSVGGVHGVGRRYPGVPVFKQVLSRSELAIIGDAHPVVRILHKAALRKMTGQGAPGMSWSTVFASLRLHDGTVPRAQGQQCGQHVVAASGIRSFGGPRLSLMRHASCRRRQVSYDLDIRKGTRELSMLAWRTASFF